MGGAIELFLQLFAFDPSPSKTCVGSPEFQGPQQMSLEDLSHVTRVWSQANDCALVLCKVLEGHMDDSQMSSEFGMPKTIMSE